MKNFFVFSDLLDVNANLRGSKVAIQQGRSSHSYEQLSEASYRVASFLDWVGARRFDRIGVLMDSRWEAIVSLVAIARMGCILVPLHPKLRRPQLLHIFRDCGIEILFTDLADLRDVPTEHLKLVVTVGQQGNGREIGVQQVGFDDALKASSKAGTSLAIESDVAAIIYTSGSTGLAKGVVLSHRNLIAAAEIIAGYLRNSEDDRILGVLPMSFTYGLSQFTTAARVGGTLVYDPASFPGDLLRVLRLQEITGLAGVPSFWRFFLSGARSVAQQPIEKLRYITNSGGVLPQSDLDGLRRLLPTTQIYLMYGATETLRSTYLNPEEINMGVTCIGKAIPNSEVMVVNGAGQKASVGETGELIHRGPTTALGYWGNPKLSARVFRSRSIRGDERTLRGSFVYTGDLAREDESGYLYFVGRKDDLIKTGGGFRVSLIEVTQALETLEYVEEAKAIPIEDATLGQRIVAVLVLKQGYNRPCSVLSKDCRELLPEYMMPKEFALVDELPKTPNGKVDLATLRAHVESTRRTK